MFKLILLLAIISVPAQAMTKGELKQVLAVFDAAGVPDSAVIKKAGVSLALSPISLENSPGIVYALNGEGNWVASSGPATSVTAISFQ